MKKKFLSLIATGLMLGGTSHIKAMDFGGAIMRYANHLNALDFADYLKTVIPATYVWSRFAPHAIDAYRYALCNNRDALGKQTVGESREHTLETYLWMEVDKQPEIRTFLKSHRTELRGVALLKIETWEDIGSIPLETPHAGESIENYLTRCKEQLKSWHEGYEYLLSDVALPDVKVAESK